MDYEDILMIPKLSDVDSRDNVDLSVKLSDDLKLNIPIIASPMKGIISKELIKGLDRLGGIGILHRFPDRTSDWMEDVYWLQDNCMKFGIAIGLDYYFLHATDHILRGTILNSNASILCIDVANGYLSSVHKYCHEIKDYLVKNNYKTLLMAGNVVSYEGCKALSDNGVDLIRVGIGSGTLCTTRKVTGVGIAQLRAIENCDRLMRPYKIVADGGIKYPGDVIKAISFGTDVVMIGTLFGQVFESAHNGIVYGMASRKLQEEYYHSIKSIEGIEKEMIKVRNLRDFINEFTYGIRSACTYLNARKLKDLRDCAYEVIS